MSQLTAVQALVKTLSWIDSVPQLAKLPSMPGFDRDEVDRLLAGERFPEEPPLMVEHALEWALEWVDAVPEGIKAQLGLFDRAEVVATLAHLKKEAN